MKNSFLIFIVMITGQLANASEPAYCSIANFFATEQMTSLKGVDRLRVFKVGKLTLVGAGIGNSDIKALEQFAVTNATSSRPANYCTWYLNEGNGDAETKFNHQYLPQPWNIPSIVAYQYEQILGDSFATAENNFVK